MFTAWWLCAPGLEKPGLWKLPLSCPLQVLTPVSRNPRVILSSSRRPCPQPGIACSHQLLGQRRLLPTGMQAVASPLQAGRPTFRTLLLSHSQAWSAAVQAREELGQKLADTATLPQLTGAPVITGASWLYTVCRVSLEGGRGRLPTRACN